MKSCTWDELINWLNNEFKLGRGFRTKLLELSSSLFLFCMLWLFMYWLNVLLFKVANGNNSLIYLRQIQGSSFLLRYWYSIKFRLLHFTWTHKLHLSQYIESSLLYEWSIIINNRAYMENLLPVTKKKSVCLWSDFNF